MIVYHGSTEIVKNPDISHSYRQLDFGRGFYVTTVREQAERWARRKADVLGKDRAILNIYQMRGISDEIKIKCFDEDFMEYDLIFGKVANDKVFRVVDMYHSGIWDKARALKEIRVYPSYDQVAFITQKAIDELLIFEAFEEV